MDGILAVCLAIENELSSGIGDWGGFWVEIDK